jgi:hypothetical protein
MREIVMLTTVLTIGVNVLLAAALMLALLVIADSAIKAHRAYTQLMREGALMQAGFAVQVEAQDLRVRRVSARTKPMRRSAGSRLPSVRPLPVCAA